MQTKEFKSTKAVTMISLVLTLIILLILAGVTLNLVVGEDGIIGRTISARERHEDSAEKELIELAVASAMAEGQGELTTENLNTALKEQFGNEEKVKSTSVGWKYQKNKCYKIFSNGKVEDVRLPIEYQQVEYIESTGTQYINTGIYGNNNTIIETSFVLSSDISVGYLFGACEKYNKDAFAFSYNPYLGKLYRFFVGYNIPTRGNVNNNTFSTATNVDYAYFSANTIILNDEKYTFSSNAPFITPVTLTIFCRKNPNDTELFTKFSLKYFKIKQANDIKRDFIPCYCTETVTDVDGKTCPSGTIGLYDLVEDQFYTNQGTGTFLKGEDI